MNEWIVEVITYLVPIWNLFPFVFFDILQNLGKFLGPGDGLQLLTAATLKECRLPPTPDREETASQHDVIALVCFDRSIPTATHQINDSCTIL